MPGPDRASRHTRPDRVSRHPRAAQYAHLVEAQQETPQRGLNEKKIELPSLTSCWRWGRSTGELINMSNLVIPDLIGHLDFWLRLCELERSVF